MIRGRLTLGEFVAFNAYLVMLSWPMIAFGWVTNMLQRGMASWKRMLEILDTVPAISDSAVTDRGRTAPISRGDRVPGPDVRLPRPDAVVLENISLRVERGQTVGHRRCDRHRANRRSSACCRACTIRRPARCSSTASTFATFRLRVSASAIGIVPQEPFLFSDTIAENIAFGRSETPDADARCGRTRPRSRGSTRTSTGSRAATKRWSASAGITLSGGQKQRTAIARALLIDPRILILDDALSAVDTYTEEEILARLRGVMRQRTSLIVAHRISTVRHADLIFVLDHGRIVERGHHDELVAQGGLYAEMYRKQLLEEELAAA